MTRSRACHNRATREATGFDDVLRNIKLSGLTLMSFNINGIHGKGAQLSSILMEGPQLHNLPQTSITLLQELKTDSQSLEEDPSLYSFRTNTRITHSLWCPGRSAHTAGVAILFHNLQSASILHKWTDADCCLSAIGPGHLARLDIRLNNTHFTIVNVYMPQAVTFDPISDMTLQSAFLLFTLPQCLASHPVGKLMIGGDWNMVLDPQKDCTAATRPHHSSSVFRRT